MIAEHNATDKNIGYNISFGGKQTYKNLTHTEEYKQHMRSLMLGKKVSERAIENMREAHSKERKPVIGKDIAADTVRRYESLGDAAIAVRGFKSNISRAAHSGKEYKGCYWEFERG